MSEIPGPYNKLETTFNTKAIECMIALRELATAIKDDPDLEYRNILLAGLHTWVLQKQKSLLDLFGLTEEQAASIIAAENAFNRLYNLRHMPYQEYLQTPEWKERRLRILERDNYRCQVCNSSDHLNVHHRDYSRRGDEEDSDLTTLCQGCHQVFHENSRLVRVEV